MKIPILVLAATFFLALRAHAAEPIRITTITNMQDPASAEVMNHFQQIINSRPNLFKIVDAKDATLIFMEDCMPRSGKEAYTCYYTTHYAGGSSKTLLGGGIYIADNANDVATSFVSSVAQDIVERWESISRDNTIETLESCLFLTQSSCAVPERLIPELKTKVINLSQYLQKGGLKK